MKYKLTSYQVFIGAEFELKTGVIPLNLIQYSPTEFYIMCLEPIFDDSDSDSEDKDDNDNEDKNESEESRQ